MASAREIPPRLAPIVGALSAPDEIPRPHDAGQRINGIVRYVCRKPQLTAFSENPAEPLQSIVLDESSLPVTALRPRVGVKQIDPRQRGIGQTIQQVACID